MDLRTATWIDLNAFLLGSDEATCERLIHEEIKGARRLMYLHRIHSRLNKMRAARERNELRAIVAEARK